MPLHSIVRYAILSHCWGPDMPDASKLTKENIGSRLEIGLDSDGLVKNFQDAIKITRALRIPYLWIDSLCIIQDSIEDCGSEASKMAQYYAGAELCISAIATANAREGSIHDRRIAHESVKLDGHCDGLGLRIVAQDVFGVLGVEGPMRWAPRWRPEIVHQPLNGRSWTLQERMFSKRTVYITAQQMVWQCDTSLLGEHGQVAEDLSTDPPPGPLTRKSRFDVSIVPLPREINTTRSTTNYSSSYSLEEALLHNDWFTCLEEYKERQVTYTSDLLPAMSAIASEVQKQTDATYIAGLWLRDDVIPIRCLLWQAVTPGVPVNNDLSSWSWSSLSGKIAHPSDARKIWDHPGGVLEYVPIGAPTVTTARPTGVLVDVLASLVQRRAAMQSSDFWASRDDSGTSFRPSVSSKGPDYSADVPAALEHIFSLMPAEAMQAMPNITSKTWSDGGWQSQFTTFDSANPGSVQTSGMTRLVIRYPHENSQIDVHDADVPLVASNTFGQVRHATLRSTGLVSEYRRAEHYDYAAERDAVDVQLLMTDIFDTDEDSKSTEDPLLLLFVAKFRDDYDGGYSVTMPADDQRQFLILKPSGSEYRRCGVAKLMSTNRDQPYGHNLGACSYTEDNGWVRKTVTLI